MFLKFAELWLGDFWQAVQTVSSLQVTQAAGTKAKHLYTRAVGQGEIVYRPPVHGTTTIGVRYIVHSRPADQGQAAPAPNCFSLAPVPAVAYPKARFSACYVLFAELVLTDWPLPKGSSVQSAFSRIEGRASRLYTLPLKSCNLDMHALSGAALISFVDRSDQPLG